MENREKAFEHFVALGVKTIDIVKGINMIDKANKYTYAHKFNGYISDYEKINSMLFKTETEIKLVNALFEAVDNEKFNINEFYGTVKFTFRLLKIESDWS